MPQHIKRLIITFAVVILLFLGFRYLLIPESFGEYGHYRGKSLEENAALPLRYAGTESCAPCHQDMLDERNLGHHSGVACETCHGPAYSHSVLADTSGTQPLPDSLKLARNTSRAFCATCHEMNAARVKMIADTVDMSMVKMIREKEHGQFRDKETNELYKCVECHNPHDP